MGWAVMSALPDPRREQVFTLDSNGTSPATRELVEAEVRQILNASSQQAHDLLEVERSRLDALVDALLIAETLDTAEANHASGPEFAGAAEGQAEGSHSG